MRHRRAWSAAAAVAVAGAVLVTLTPSGGSEAQWRDSATNTASGPSSDSFDMTATTVRDDQALTWPSGRWRNSPSMSLSNQSSRHSSWVDVRSTRLSNAVPNDSNAILQQMAFDYTFGAGACGAGSQSTYWQARGVGGISDGTTYSRSSSKVDGATLAPGATKRLCPLVRHNYATDTEAGQRDLLLNHAGRAVDITTVVRQRSEAPATWASQEQSVTSRYRIAMPPPVKPSSGDVCRTTTSSGDPDSILPEYYGGFFWGWPDAAASSSTPTPAMAGGWDIMRQTPTGQWEVWKPVPEANVRSLAGINSNDISDELNEVRSFKLRGYPFADESRYVESQWIVKARNVRPLLITRWECVGVETNPDAGPHNMP